MGRPPILDKKLIHKIAKKVRKSDLAIVKSVSALASRKNIAPEVALVITANKYEIGSSSVFKKLNPSQQIQLATETSKRNIPGNSQHEGKSLLTGRNSIATGSIHNNYSFFSCGFYIDIV